MPEKLICIINICSPYHNDYSSSSSYKTKRAIIADTEALFVFLPSTTQNKNLTNNYFDFKYETLKGYSKTEPLYFSDHLECKLDFYKISVFSCLKEIRTKTLQPSWKNTVLITFSEIEISSYFVVLYLIATTLAVYRSN